MKGREGAFLREDRYHQSLKNAKSFWYLLRFIKPHQRIFWGAIALLSLGAIIAIASARMMGALVEEGLMAQNGKAAWAYAASIFALEGLVVLLVWWGRKMLAQGATDSIFLIRQHLFRHIHLLPMSYYDREPQGRTVTRLTHDVEGMEQFFAISLGRILNSLIIFITAIGAMIFTQWDLGILLVLAMFPALFLTWVTRGRIQYVNREMSRHNSARNAKMAELIKGLEVIRSFGLESWATQKYEVDLGRHERSQLQANLFYAWSRPLTNLLCGLPLVGLFWWGGQGVMAGSLTIGVFVAFVRYCERFSFPLDAITREIQVIQQAFTSSERVVAFLKAAKEDDVMGKDGAYEASHLKGEIIFDQVSMAYETGRSVLSKVSFHIQAGEKIGLAGRTGSGKTTTVSLLARLYDFQEGHIFIDGHSIRDYRRDSLRDQLGFVSQDVIIFRGSLRENLSCGLAVADQVIIKACQQTGLAQVMDKNQIDLDSEILEGGSNLSMGERQLVNLTRILLKNPSILILDEATANVDEAFEVQIHRAVDLVMKDRTCLMIAHRLATLKDCDRIFYFNRGELEIRTPHSVLEDCHL